MNLSEFKAWFEGFTESMDGPPSAKAWKRIQDRVTSIKSDEPTTRHVFHEYYARPWQRWYNDGLRWGVAQSIGLVSPPTALAGSSVTHSNPILQQANNAAMAYQTDGPLNALAAPADFAMSVTSDEPFNAQSAFNKLGKAEALSLTHAKIR